MAKNNNLKDFLTDVADAIREKKGITEKINPQNFSDEIRGIESGGNFSYELKDNTVIAYNNYTKINIHEGVRAVSCNDMSSLVEVTLPSTIREILNSGFQNTKIRNIELPQGIQKLNMNAFHNCTSLTAIFIPNSATSIQSPCFGVCTSLSEIVVDSNNTVYDSRDNCNAIIQTKTNTLIEGGISTVIPNGVVKIGNYAFRGRGPERLVFPQSVTTIDVNAFNSNTHTDVYDFRNVISIPTLAATNAFTGTLTTSKIVVPNDLYETWKGKTNWVTYANRIVKAEDFENQN